MYNRYNYEEQVIKHTLAYEAHEHREDINKYLCLDNKDIGILTSSLM